MLGMYIVVLRLFMVFSAFHRAFSRKPTSPNSFSRVSTLSHSYGSKFKPPRGPQVLVHVAAY